MILNHECKKVGVSVADLSAITGVSENTLRNWCKSRELFMSVFFNGLKSTKLVLALQDLETNKLNDIIKIVENKDLK